jgi:hypothetical protein
MPMTHQPPPQLPLSLLTPPPTPPRDHNEDIGSLSEGPYDSMHVGDSSPGGLVVLAKARLLDCILRGSAPCMPGRLMVIVHR